MRPFEIKNILLRKKYTPREKIRLIAKKSNLPFSELARKANIKVKTCQKILEEEPISLNNYIKMIKALDMDDDMIMKSLGFQNFEYKNRGQLGNYVEFLRKENNLSKHELLNEINKIGKNISLSKYNNFIKGKSYLIDVEIIQNLSKVLKPEKVHQNPYVFARRAIVSTGLSISQLSLKSNTGMQTWYALYNNRNISLTKYLDIMHTLKFNDKSISFIIGLPKNVKPNIKSIGSYLSKLRKSKGLTAKEVAKIIGISYISYHLLENGKSNPSVITCYYAVNVINKINNKDKYWIKETLIHH